MQRLKRQEIYSARVFQVCRDTVQMADGRTAEWGVVVHPGAVVVVAVDGEHLLFVRQFRYPTGESLLELVAGTLEPGEDPGVTAGRELQEEAGFRAGKLTRLGQFYSAPGFCSELLHCYLAEELRPSRLAPDDDEEIELERYTLSEALAMCSAGAIRDAKTLAGLMLYTQHVGR